MSNNNSTRIAVIGAGPAGLMAAERLATAGHGVTVFERMASPARKFLMAGRGGLNLTHAMPLPRFLERYREGRTVVEGAVSTLSPADLVTWCHELGIETFEGTSGRIFPVGLKASPLLRAWLKRLSSQGVELVVRHRWTGFSPQNLLSFETPTGESLIEADAVVLALGGASWPRLGSDGSWTIPLETLGISITPLSPSNAGVRVAWSDIFRDRFAGEPIKRIVASIAGVEAMGELMVTAAGLEGGAIYDLNGALRAHGLATGAPTQLTLDLRPDHDEMALADALSKPFAKQSLTNVLRKRAGLAPAAIGLLREAAGRDLPRDAEALAHLIKHCKIAVTGFAGIERAISTAGGISAEAIDANFMLKNRPGVFVAGEMLDWDASTGGFLLQASFATGRAAADGVLTWLAR